MVAKPNGHFIDDVASDAGDAVIPANIGHDGVRDDDGVITGFETFDPGTGSTTGGTGTGPGSGGSGKRRGRPPGSGSGTRTGSGSKKASKGDLSSVETLLLTIHFGLSSAMKVPELEMDPAEAKALAEAFANVAAQYDHQMNPRTLAWMQLALVAGGIYGTRVFAYTTRRKEESANGPKVVPMRVTDPGKGAEVPVQNRAAAPMANPSDIFGLGFNAALPEMG